MLFCSNSKGTERRGRLDDERRINPDNRHLDGRNEFSQARGGPLKFEAKDSLSTLLFVSKGRRALMRHGGSLPWNGSIYKNKQGRQYDMRRAH